MFAIRSLHVRKKNTAPLKCSKITQFWQTIVEAWFQPLTPLNTEGGIKGCCPEAPRLQQVLAGVCLQGGHQQPGHIGMVPHTVQMNPVKPHRQRYLSGRQLSVHRVIAAPGAGSKTQWLIQKGTKISSRGKLLIQCQIVSLRETEESFKMQRAVTFLHKQETLK